MALMIAVYGTARLINDCLGRYESEGATVMMIVLSIGAALALWGLAFFVLMSGVPAP